MIVELCNWIQMYTSFRESIILFKEPICRSGSGLTHNLLMSLV